jgi:acyl carrier protein
MELNKSSVMSLLETAMELEPGSLNDCVISELDMWDSMSVVTFIALVDERLGKNVAPRKLSEAKTVGDIVELVLNS